MSTEQKSSSEELAMLSRTIRERSLLRINSIPDGFRNWRMNNTTLSFAHLVKHLINVDELFLKMIQSDSKHFHWVLGTEEAHFEVDAKEYSQLIIRLKDLQLERENILKNLKDSDLKQLIFDEEQNEYITLWWFIMRKLIEHEVYHRGQLSVYLKILKGESPNK